MSDYMQGNPDTGSVAVPFSDDDSGERKGETLDLLDEGKPDESPEARKTRKQKQQERLQGLLQNGRVWEEKAKKLEERDAQRERELAELRGMLTERQRHEKPQGDGKSKIDRELDAVYARQAEAYKAAQAEIKAGTFTEERARHYEGVARDIEETKADLITQRALSRIEPQRRAEQGQQRWINAYPDVYRNQKAYQYAEGRFKQRAALGEEVTEDLVHEVMRETLTQFKLGPKPAPTASEKSRMSGVPSSGGGGGGGGSNALNLDPQVRKIAVAAYPDLSEAEALKAWANKTGKRMRERKLL